MDYSAFMIDTSQDYGDDIGVVHTDDVFPNREWRLRQAVYKGEPIFRANGEPIIEQYIDIDAPRGMRFLDNIPEGTPSMDLLYKMLQTFNGEYAVTTQYTHNRNIHDEEFCAYGLYATPYGTGDPDTRFNLTQMLNAMIDTGLHSDYMQNTVLPQLPPEIAEMYRQCPTGDTLWLGYTGTRICDLSLPQNVIESQPCRAGTMQWHMTQQLFMPDNIHDEYWRTTYFYAEEYSWANRVANFLNEQAGTTICQISGYRDIEFLENLSDEKRDFIVDTFINKDTFIYKKENAETIDKIAQMISDPALLAKYQAAIDQIVSANRNWPDETLPSASKNARLADVARNMAWIALTGTDPRIYDDIIEIPNRDLEYSLREQVNEPLSLDEPYYDDRYDDIYDER